MDLVSLLRFRLVGGAPGPVGDADHTLQASPGGTRVWTHQVYARRTGAGCLPGSEGERA